MAQAHYLLSFPTHGTCLPSPSRGRHVRIEGDLVTLPQPVQPSTARQGAAMKWPAVTLDARQQRIVADDIARVASIRGFDLLDVAVSSDCVHVMFAGDESADARRLVQFIKGASARALTVAVGDAPIRSDEGEILPHRKWWARQYELQRLTTAAQVEKARGLLRGGRSDEPGAPATGPLSPR